MGQVNYSSNVKVEAPVVRNECVAPGCEKFTPEVVKMNQPVAKKSLFQKIKDFFNHNDCCE